MDKLKASDKLAFPLELDLGGILRNATLGGASEGRDGGATASDSSGEPVGRYELVGVLIHKGTNAHHGHYGVCEGEGSLNHTALDSECLGHLDPNCRPCSILLPLHLLFMILPMVTTLGPLFSSCPHQGSRNRPVVAV